LDALIFDFDGVIVDSEPIHLVCFGKVLLPAGVVLTHEDYYEKYLGFDDHDCFVAAMRDHGKPVVEEQIAAMTRAKSLLVQETYSREVTPLPGSAELIRAAARAKIPLAVCSGALRDEIEQAARAVGVRDLFATLVAARDVTHGKPDPEGYRMALERLRAATGRALRAEASVVVEDSVAGIDAALGAGMKVLAVTNSYPAEALHRAGRVVRSLAEVTLKDLEAIAGEAG
jgi:beta-phosphoglucomutase